MDHFFIIVKGHFAYKHERNCIFNNTKDVSDVRGYVFRDRYQNCKMAATCLNRIY